MICASEDVGNADPLALVVAQAAFQAAQDLGMPEARITLAHAALYVACAPKSNSVVAAIDAAMEEAQNGPAREVPPNLRPGAKGKGYIYPHDYPGHYAKQEYMPQRKIFYNPSDQGREAQTAERLKKLRGEK